MSDSICAFGDSIIKGVVYDTFKGKYIYSESSFAKSFAKETGFSVDNYAKFGCTLGKGERIIEKYFSKLSQYRFVVLEFGGNDCDFFWPAISDNPGGKHLPNTPLDTFERIYSQTIDRLKAKKCRPILFSLPPLDPHKYFSWLSRGLNGENILKWLGEVEFIYKWQEMYSDAVVKLAKTKEVPLIDIRSAFLNAHNYSDLLCDDGIHPNEAGHSLIFETIRKYIPQIKDSSLRSE